MIRHPEIPPLVRLFTAPAKSLPNLRKRLFRGYGYGRRAPPANQPDSRAWLARRLHV